ncbi:BSD domain-containing protein [Aspergillus undulatus]|uniref:BSD domain-containing protein n=1 Tax=Aspergillus undulatus TaxID=1810928 RepID=UPI003CCD1ACC
MDIYDQVQGDFISAQNQSRQGENQENASKNKEPAVDLNTELQETFRAFSASPWGSRIGDLWGTVRKQGESYYEGARQEYAAASEEAVKGFSGLKDSLVGRTRGLSLNTAFGTTERGTTEGSLTPTESRADESSKTEKQQDGSGSDSKAVGAGVGEGFLERIKAEASRRLKELEKAEEAADEAILQFGKNITQRLREAVTIVAPEDESGSNVLFESKDAEGKRVIHATRFEAQLHVIHTSLDSFLKDPVSDEWPAFQKSFNIDDKTSAIAADLEKYPELRTAMEKLVPEKVQYADFWSRYYFLRLVIETEEQKRKELLKGASAEDEEEVGWDDDSDDDADSPSTPQVSNKTCIKKDTTAKPPTAPNTLKPTEPRRSNDQNSQPDSESSYDVVSGATSRTPASPKEKPKDDDSDDDWE